MEAGFSSPPGRLMVVSEEMRACIRCAEGCAPESEQRLDRMGWEGGRPVASRRRTAYTILGGKICGIPEYFPHNAGWLLPVSANFPRSWG